MCKSVVSKIGVGALWLICLVPATVQAQGYAPEVATEKLWTASGVRATLFAHEPHIRQPIFVQCDDRGRLWTIQYLQYPNPAGLKRVEVDRWSRTIYDRIPEPPPRGPRGADRITIIEDRDRDGRADHYKEFVTGLNLTTGVALGHGGVFVLNVPYLLFYPDRDRDDVPDADPSVLLEGFGMEDAQSFSNHLTWGPDGWLYGVNGSTTTCKIRGIEFQQAVWRYHPVRQEFELFCEGGANCYGLTFDERGNLFYSTNGGPFVHAIQGGYFYKSFGKHGPLHNPYAYHFFGPLECDQAPGGPPTGGTIYRHEMFRDKLNGQFIAGNFLGHTASAWDVAAKGSTFRAKFAGPFFDARDTWSGPTDLCVGPHGELYIADFYDQRTAHPDPDASWDTSNGRIYRLENPHFGSQQPTSNQVGTSSFSMDIVDVREVESKELVEVLCGPETSSHQASTWLKDRALVELASRLDRSVLPQLDRLIADRRSLRLVTIWARYVIDGLPDDLAVTLLQNSDEYVRAWTIRLAADDREVSPELVNRFIDLARLESSPVVRAALATAAKRLPAEQCLPIAWAMMERGDQLIDERVDWSIWWAVEDKCASTSMIENWSSRVASETGRLVTMVRNLLVRRYAAEGTNASYATCLKLLRDMPKGSSIAAYQSLRDGLIERAKQPLEIGQGGLFEFAAVPSEPPGKHQGKTTAPISDELREWIAGEFAQHAQIPVCMELGLLAKLPAARGALAGFVDSHSDNALREHALTPEEEAKLPLIAQYADVEMVPGILAWFERTKHESLCRVLLAALGRFDSEVIAQRLLAVYPLQSTVVRQNVHEVLLSRRNWSKLLVGAVQQGVIKSQDVALNQVARIALHKDPELDGVVKQIWGRIGPGTPEEKLAIMRRFNNDLRAAVGNAENGKTIFARVCGTCHKLHGEGGAIGPDLTSTSRKDVATLLANIVDPSSVIRRDYLSYVARTVSGSVYTGLISEQDAGSMTIVDAENRRTKIARDELDEMRESPQSIMPERLLEQLTPQQLRDLFAYVQRD